MYKRQMISSHYVARLRECISLDNHRCFLQQKYNWSNNAWLLIAWDALMKCARKPALTQPVTRSKLVHNWLHLGSQRVKFGSGGTTLEIERCCPYCNQAEQDVTHLLTCADPQAMKFRYDASIPFRKVLSKLGEAGAFLLRVIQVLWTKTPLDPINIPPVDEALGIQCAIKKAVQSQTCIGWSNFFRGFVSLDWGAITSRTDLNRRTPDDRYAQSEKTLTAVITAVQEYSLAIWKSRNDVLHEAGSDSLSIVHAALNHSITQLYSLRSTFSPILQSYFTVPLEDRLRQSPRQRARWLALARWKF